MTRPTDSSGLGTYIAAYLKKERKERIIVIGPVCSWVDSKGQDVIIFMLWLLL